VTPRSPLSLRPAGHQQTALRRNPLPLPLAALLAYTLLLVYGSLSPWTGWRSLGVGPLAFLGAPWPAYITAFDVTLNVLAYLPLGLLLALALHPRPQAARGVVASIVIAAGFSVLIEGAQSYLPARVASNVDFLANIAGAAIGALAGAAMAPALIDDLRLAQARRRWLRPHAAVVLTLVALWPLAQTHPGPMLFGNGELDRELLASLRGLFGRMAPDFDAGRFAAAEVLVTACAMLGAGAAMTVGLKAQAPRRRLLMATVICALAAKVITYGHEFGPERAFGWLTTGALAGLAIGLLAMVAVAATASARAAALLATAALLVLVVTVNAVPSNPYHAHWLSEWRPGHLRNVAAAVEWLARAWPYAMVAALLWGLWRTRRRPGAGRGHSTSRPRSAS
jgi:VanZ family protein